MYWFDGQLTDAAEITLAVDEPAFIYGATVFTTLRVYEDGLDHPLTAWQQHCDRIAHSLQDLRWLPPDWPRLRAGAVAMKAAFPVLRLTIFPDGRELITGRALPADLIQRQTRGITAWVADVQRFQRALAGYKTGNYLSSWLALRAAKEQAAAEAILINQKGAWLETSTGNLWGWAAGTWWTPPLQGNLLPGVMRSQILRHLAERGYPGREAPWNPSLVGQFTALAYCNSVVEWVPIHTVLAAQTRLEYNPNHKAFSLFPRRLACL